VRILIGQKIEENAWFSFETFTTSTITGNTRNHGIKRGEFGMIIKKALTFLRKAQCIFLGIKNTAERIVGKNQLAIRFWRRLIGPEISDSLQKGSCGYD